MREEDLGKHLIRLFKLEEDEYTYTYNKKGYDFHINKPLKEELGINNFKKIISKYYEEQGMIKTNEDPLHYMNPTKGETIQLIKNKLNNKVYKIKLTTIENKLS